VGSEKNQSHTSQDRQARRESFSPSLPQPSRSFRSSLAAAAAETLAVSPASGSSSPSPPTPDRLDLETVEPRWRTGVSTSHSLSRLSILRNSLPEFAARFDSSSLCSRCASRDVTLKRLTRQFPNLGKPRHFCVKTILQEDFTS
jgi:hypothetical protein